MTSGKDCVLGSGPAAVAAAHALIKAGRSVVLIDPARALSADRLAIIEDFRTDPDPEKFVAKMRALRRNLPRNLQAKRLPFSSPHAYQDIDRILPVRAKGVTVSRSLASGGLSAMWGATVMPLSARSFRNWPVTLEEMAPFYRGLSDIIDVPTVNDDLTSLYPNFGTAPPTALSQQGAQLLSNLLNHSGTLAKDGITYGRCRSAVGSMYSSNGKACVYCGLCMYGCPTRAIFNAEFVIEKLATSLNFERRKNWLAETFQETQMGVSVRLRHLDNNATETLSCDRLFVACGATTSLRLVAGAMGWHEDAFTLQDTQLVAIPAFLRSRSGAGPVPRANALGQVFVEIDDPAICDELLHLQIYGFNPFIADLLRDRWGLFYPGDGLMQPIFDRMMLIMGYLPGQLSSRVELRVSKAGANQIGLPEATFTTEPNPRLRDIVHKLGRKLKSHQRTFGWFPLVGMIQTPNPGESHHLAGGMPMRAAPNPRESDILGRPGGLKRVHIVDGACFSDLPGEHLTYTIMANAARIATKATERPPS